MTTSVIYDNGLRGLNIAAANVGNGGNFPAGATTDTIYNNLSTMLTTGVTQVQSVNNSASTTNPTATFTNTPTNGNALIAVVCRTDNIASTNASWTLLSGVGVSGSRRVEIWWRRAGASEAKTHTWTNATAALWDCTLIEFGGWASVANPILLTSFNQTTAGTGTGTQYDCGILATVQVMATGGTAGTFSNTATNAETNTVLPFTTTARFYGTIVDGYTNRDQQSISFSWTTSRGWSYVQVGWPNGASTSVLTSSYPIGAEKTTAGASTYICGQLGMTFDTSSIPTANTVTSATLSLKSGSYSNAWPSTASVDVYSLAGASIAASNTNGPAVFKTPSEIGTLTRVATRAAGATTAINTVYNWTSDAAFLTNVNKGGTTSLLVATSDQGSGTTRTTDQYAWLSNTSGSVHYLTIVHNLQLARTATATVGSSPTVARIADASRTIAGTFSAVPAVQRAATYGRTVATLLGLSPAVVATRTYVRTVANTVDLSPLLTRATAMARTITTSVGTVIDLTAVVVAGYRGLYHQLVLRTRSTVRLPTASRIRLAVRSRLRLPE